MADDVFDPFETPRCNIHGTEERVRSTYRLIPRRGGKFSEWGLKLTDVTCASDALRNSGTPSRLVFTVEKPRAKATVFEGTRLTLLRTNARLGDLRIALTAATSL